MVNLQATSRSSKLRPFQLAIALVVVAALFGCSFSNPWMRRNTSHARPTAAEPDNGYFKGAGGKLVDSRGHPANLVGVSWFGFETGSCAPHGLSARNWRDMLEQMSKVGFNTVRLPYSNQFLDDPACVPTDVDYRKNPDLKGLTGLALLDRIVNEAGRQGLKVILDRHTPAPDTHGDLWYTDQVPESRWIDDWVMLARHYRGNRAVIGADLANEPHGAATWGDENPRTDWRLAAEAAGNAILAVNPQWLILVQGIEYHNGDRYWWGGQLQAAALHPVRLLHPEKLVYAPHDYGPSVWPQRWFEAPDFPENMPQIWDQHWGNLAQQGAALLMGEFSGRLAGDKYGITWQRTLMSYLDQRGIGFIYWAWNPDSADTDSVLEADWTTINQRVLDVLLGHQSMAGAVQPAGSPAPGNA